MIYLFSVSIIMLFVFTIIAAWRTGIRHWSLWVIIPFLIFNLGFSWYTISSLKGYPYAAYPPGDHQLLYFAEAKPVIYILTQGPKKEPRLYVVDHSDELSKKLAQAGKQLKNGQTVMTRRTGNLNQGELEFYNFELQKSYPKD